MRRRASLPSLHFSSGWDPSRRPLPRAFSLGLWRVSRLGLVHLIVSFALVRSHSDPARHRLWRPWGGWCRGSVHSRPSGRSFISPSRNPHLPSLRVNGRRHSYRLGLTQPDRAMKVAIQVRSWPGSTPRQPVATARQNLSGKYREIAHRVVLRLPLRFSRL